MAPRLNPPTQTPHVLIALPVTTRNYLFLPPALCIQLSSILSSSTSGDTEERFQGLPFLDYLLYY